MTITMAALKAMMQTCLGNVDEHMPCQTHRRKIAAFVLSSDPARIVRTIGKALIIEMRGPCDLDFIITILHGVGALAVA